MITAKYATLARYEGKAVVILKVYTGPVYSRECPQGQVVECCTVQYASLKDSKFNVPTSKLGEF